VPERPFYSVTYSPGKFPTRVERTDADVGADGLVAAELTSLNPGRALSIAVCAGATRDACAGPGDAAASCTRTVQTSTRAATASRCDELVNADVAGADLYGVAPDGSRLGTGLSRAACCARCLDVQAFLPYHDRCVAATFEARRAPLGTCASASSCICALPDAQRGPPAPARAGVHGRVLRQDERRVVAAPRLEHARCAPGVGRSGEAVLGCCNMR
jgi:hypothetical protein